MSGGTFGYAQYRCNDIADMLKEEIENNNVKDNFGYCNNFSEETLNKFKETLKDIEIIAKKVQRIDWLLAGDDGEETFHERWKEEGLE